MGTDAFDASAASNRLLRPVTTRRPTDTRPTTLRYLPGLDGLRAISVLAVIVFHHYFIGGTKPGWAPGGFLGVEVFFVVSGYLITSLLLDRAARDRAGLVRELLHPPRPPAAARAVGCCSRSSSRTRCCSCPTRSTTLRGDVIAALTYTSNWWQIIAHRSYFVEAGRPELLKHLWSLAIEEQFYLVVAVVLMLGLRKLGRQRMLVTMIVSVASRRRSCSR